MLFAITPGPHAVKDLPFGCPLPHAILIGLLLYWLAIPYLKRGAPPTGSHLTMVLCGVLALPLAFFINETAKWAIAPVVVYFMGVGIIFLGIYRTKKLIRMASANA